jgi:hypothetical protein
LSTSFFAMNSINSFMIPSFLGWKYNKQNV